MINFYDWKGYEYSRYKNIRDTRGDFFHQTTAAHSEKELIMFLYRKGIKVSKIYKISKQKFLNEYRKEDRKEVEQQVLHDINLKRKRYYTSRLPKD